MLYFILASSTSSDTSSFFTEYLPILIAIVGGTIVGVVILTVICCWCQRRRQRRKRYFDSRSDRSNSEISRNDSIEMKSISPRTSSNKGSLPSKVNYKCGHMKLAKEFVSSLNWVESLFNPFYDACYCKNCYPSECENVTAAGNAEYVIPREWVRLGLRVDPVIQEHHDIWNKWIVTFHGTSIVAAHSILTNRQFCLPGDILIDGTVLGIHPGHIPNKKHIYTSPTIAYSSLPVYSPKKQFHSSRTKLAYEVQVVLQCRQKPRSFTVQGETIGAKSKRICKFIPNEQVEYFTEIRSSIVPYGLLVRFHKVLDDDDF
ncbi:unnamed protein product [Rotaria sp. Silwood2]|nr:unnamed protein product [Rotaria sp. Silwood2]CAF4262815.1 unnamed protein product [Rotaria sp. Silwood2]